MAAVIGVLLIVLFSVASLGQDAFDSGTTHSAAGSDRFGVARGNDTRYLIYSVNPGEGFNLHRDVYMRAAIVVKQLRDELNQDWVLVLPPWQRMYHWRSDIPQSDLPWRMFFDLQSLNEFVPVLEFEDFIQDVSHSVDEVIHLQGIEWTEFEEKWAEEKCKSPPRYKKRDGLWYGRFFGYDNSVHAKSFRCISVLGGAWALMKGILTREDFAERRSFLVERFEEVIHDYFGEDVYWEARRSLVYAFQLRTEGYRFMEQTLGYVTQHNKGRTLLLNGGGDYLAVHLRRGDYLHAHPEDIPTIKGAANQMKQLMEELNLSQVFVATDADDKDRQQLSKLVPNLHFYRPSADLRASIGDGGVAIMDQWICAHAGHFVGSHESTFTFRIREDRQLMGLSRESTFNDLCGVGADEGDPHSCSKPSYWPVNGEERQFSYS